MSEFSAHVHPPALIFELHPPADKSEGETSGKYLVIYGVYIVKQLHILLYIAIYMAIHGIYGYIHPKICIWDAFGFFGLLLVSFGCLWNAFGAPRAAFGREHIMEVRAGTFEKVRTTDGHHT